MELAILILLVCILLLLIFYGFYFTKKINSIYTNVHNTIVQYMSNYDKRLDTHSINVLKAFDALSNTFVDCINKANEDISTAAIQRVTAKLEETYKENML